MKYEERVKIAAKRHAEKYNEGRRQEYAGSPYLRKKPEQMEDEADLTVSMQAEAIRESLPIIFKHPEIAKYVEQYLKQNGYIPENEEE